MVLQDTQAWGFPMNLKRESIDLFGYCAEAHGDGLSLAHDSILILPDAGIFTKTTFLRKDDTVVRMIAVNHYGVASYWSEICADLRECEAVLFEGMPSKRSKEFGGLMKRIEHELLRQSTPNEEVDHYAACNILGQYQAIVHQQFDFQFEATAIADDQKHWYCGDEFFWDSLLYDEEAFQRYIEANLESGRVVPREQYEHLMALTQYHLEALEEGTWHPSMYVEHLQCMSTPEFLFAAACERLGCEENTLAQFDSIEGRYKKIGIKFGAMHAPKLIRGLEHRGYEQFFSSPRCVVSW